MEPVACTARTASQHAAGVTHWQRCGSPGRSLPAICGQHGSGTAIAELAVAASPSASSASRTQVDVRRQRRNMTRGLEPPGRFVNEPPNCARLIAHGSLELTVFNRGWQRLRRQFAKDGVRPLTLHSARHTWATLALRAGKSIRWIAEQLGHSDPAITLRIYAHVLPDEGEDLGFLDFGTGRSTSGSMTTGQVGALVELRGKGGE